MTRSHINRCLSLAVGLLLYCSGSVQARAQDYEFHSFDAPFVADTEPYGVNDEGLISGQYLAGDGTIQVFTFDRGVFSTIVVPGSVFGFAGGPNNHGQVPISWLDAAGIVHPALWQSGRFTLL